MIPSFLIAHSSFHQPPAYLSAKLGRAYAPFSAPLRRMGDGKGTLARFLHFFVPFFFSLRLFFD